MTSRTILPPDPQLRRSTAQAGFTLIEALIAMVVLTLLAAVLLRGTVAVRSDAAWYGDHAAATLVATSLLDGAIADRTLRNGTYRGARNGIGYTLVATAAGIVGNPVKFLLGNVSIAFDLIFMCQHYM